MKIVTDSTFEEHECPGCKAKLKFEKEPPTHTITTNGGFAPEDLERAVERAIEKKMPKEPEKPKDADVPSYLPKHFCKGKGCEGHDNQKRKKVTKKCNNCDQVAPENAGKCPWCGEKDFDDLDEDDQERYNKGMEHEHEHE